MRARSSVSTPVDCGRLICFMGKAPKFQICIDISKYAFGTGVEANTAFGRKFCMKAEAKQKSLYPRKIQLHRVSKISDLRRTI
jgi:hypothetical protein